MFILPEIAPGVSESVGAILDATMLSLMAGPVILWRLCAAMKRAGNHVQPEKTDRPWRLICGVIGVLVLGLTFTALTVRSESDAVRREAHTRFERWSERLVAEACDRVTQALDGLNAARGLYAASKSVERGEFEKFVTNLDMKERFPGIHGFGFVQPVRPADLDKFVAAERADDAPDFALKFAPPDPTGGSEARECYVVKFIEPFSRNLSARGTDFAADPPRRAALDQSMRSGQPTLTGRVTLFQDELKRPASVCFLPVYRNGTNPTTPEERTRDLVGWVYAPFVVEEVMAAVADSADGMMDLEIFDGTQPAEENKMFDFDRHLDSATGMIEDSNYADRLLKTQTQLTIGGRPWTIVTTTLPKFEAGIDHSTPVMLGVGGALLSVLVAAVVWSMGTSRSRALTLATSMTTDLSAAKASADRLADIARRTSNAVVITDAQGRIEWTNEGFTRISGYTLDEVKGQKPGSFLHGPKSDRLASRRMGEAVRRGEGCLAEIVNYDKSGREYTLSIELAPLRNEAGVLTGFMAIETDITEQKRAADELAASEARARAALDASPVPMAINEGDRITYLNPAFIRTFGYDTTDIKTLADWWPRAYPNAAYQHEVAESWMEELQSSQRTGKPFRPMELRIRAKTGAELVALVSAEPIRDKSQDSILVMLYDITERKQAEQELALATAMLERTGELAQVGGWSVDLATMKLSWTRETFRIAEIDPPNEPDLETGVSLFAPEARPIVAAAVQAAMETGTPYDLEVPLITAMGRHRWVKTQGYAEMRDGKAFRIYGTFQDVTDRRQAETELKEISERLQLATRAGGVGIWDYDVTNDRLAWDDEMFRLWGITRNQFGSVYEAWLAGVHPEDWARVEGDLQSAIRGEKEFDTEFRIVWPGGPIRHIRSVGTVQRNAAAQPVRMIGTNWDVTERKLHEEQIQDTNRQLAAALQAAEAASKAKSAFLANMSHEIRTPLTAILGFTDLLREDGNIGQAPAQRLQTIDTIKNAGNHLLTVINDILDLSKIEADRMTVERINTPLTGVLHEVVSLMRPRAADKGLSLTAALATPVPEHILSDPTRLRQILMNLAGNAIKFTESGSVTITVAATKHGESSRLVFDIEDTGAGVTKEQAGRLFQSFGQADETMTRRFGGTGLGLAICRRLAILMGGDATLLRTEPGKGSCFRLVLPLEAAPGAAMVTRLDAVSPPNTQAAANIATKLDGRILLVEDGADNQRLIAFYLKKAGAQIAIADNGKIAMEMIDKAAAEGTPYDLLLTDMQMPEMDGYTLASTLRKRGSTLPIVALTAHAMADERQKCLDAGCDDYASKPIDKEKLLATCAEWMAKAHAASVSATAG
jgi:PAS domain S-box-containing protein